VRRARVVSSIRVGFAGESHEVSQIGMAYFPDMETTTQIVSGPAVRAVGWLAAAAPYSTGETPPEFVSKLRLLARNWGASTVALGWPAAGGTHTCEMCGNVRAAGNFGIPGDSVLYVAPEMVAHYVEAHRYAPPEGFITAVLRCPLPDTPEYARAVEPFLASEAG
jgi:hypothetical protein